jgi:hypothetical protein
VFLKTRFFALVRDKSKLKEYYLVSSPQAGPICVTVSENLDNLQRINWPKVEVTGADLLKELPPETEIVITYADGGNYLSKEELKWLRGLAR